jgi:hypothetical protein
MIEGFAFTAGPTDQVAIGRTVRSSRGGRHDEGLEQAALPLRVVAYHHGPPLVGHEVEIAVTAKVG